MSRPVTDKQFRALIENSGDGLALIAADGSILYASPPGARILGRDAITSIGRPALDLVHAQDLSRACTFCQRLRQTPGTTATPALPLNAIVELSLAALCLQRLIWFRLTRAVRFAGVPLAHV